MSPDDAAPLDIYAAVAEQPQQLQALLLGLANAREAEISEAHTASFVVATYRQLSARSWRWLFLPRLSDGLLLKWMPPLVAQSQAE